MKRARSILLFGLALCGLAGAAHAAPADDVAIRQTEAAQEVAWNAHDAHAFAQAFTPNADIVTAEGWWWKGSAEAERKLAAGFSFLFADSRLHIDEVTIRSLTPDLAIAHVGWSLTGVRSPDGSGKELTRHSIQTQLLEKAGGTWRISAVQNNMVLPGSGYPIVARPAVVTKTPDQPARPCLLANRWGTCLIEKHVKTPSGG